MEEGRRRRQLYDERKWAVQSELRRVLAERAAVMEKEGMLRLLLQVCILVFPVFVAGVLVLVHVPSGENLDHAAAFLLESWRILVDPQFGVRVARSVVKRTENVKGRKHCLPAGCA